MTVSPAQYDLCQRRIRRLIAYEVGKDVRTHLFLAGWHAAHLHTYTLVLAQIPLSGK